MEWFNQQKERCVMASGKQVEEGNAGEAKDSQNLITKEVKEVSEKDEWTPEEICFLDSPTAD